MKSWVFLFAVGWSICASAATLNPSIASVELSPGLSLSESNARNFPSMSAAQAYANANNLSEVAMRIRMRLAEAECHFNIPALSLGYVYDQDRAILNGQLIGSTGNPELSDRRLSLLPRVYPIPAQILKCPGDNVLDLSLKRILGGWIGPFAGSIEFGELHELQQKAMFTEAVGPLFQRDIGVLLLAITILLISLFYRYPDNHRQTAFVVFALSTSLLCLSLSGWYYRYFDFPNVIFRLHFAFVSLALTSQILFVAAYRGIRWAQTVSKPLFFVVAFAALVAESFSVGSVSLLLNIYLIQLLVLIATSWIIYALPVIAPAKFRSGMATNWGIEGALFLIHFGASMDIARIWKLHNLENISPYTYGISIFVIGSLLAAELVKVFQKAAQTAETEAKLRQSRMQTEFARQVGHDIRSPIAALDMMVTLLTDLPEQQRLTLRNAVRRINDIANSLLDRSWSNLGKAAVNRADADPTAITDVVMLSSLVDSIVSEKRIQYRERLGVDIDADLSESYGLFSTIDATDLARALSNLIDNSVKSLGDSAGQIQISIRANAEFNQVVVSDSGSGIPSTVLDTLGAAGVKFGKNAGSGLGLFQARTAVERAGGTLSIQSELGQGTVVTISLPKADPPSWFVESLTVASDSQIVSVDDDQTVHQIWDNRLRNIGDRRPHHMAFTSIGQFEDWYGANESKKVKFLVDYEFLGQTENGLQLIQRLNLAKSAILVSSRAEDRNIQARAAALGLKLLPKALAPIIPIEVDPVP